MVKKKNDFGNWNATSVCVDGFVVWKADSMEGTGGTDGTDTPCTMGLAAGRQRATGTHVVSGDLDK